MDNFALALAGLSALLVFLMGYLFLVPKSKRGFNPDNEDIQAENAQLRFFTHMANEMMLALPSHKAKTKTSQRDIKTEALLIKAGNPWKVTVSEFKTLKITGLIFGFIIGVPLGLLVHSQQESVPVVAVIAIATLLGFNTPTSKMKGIAAKRDLEFKRQLPEALDLITISLSGGSSFTRALGSSLKSMQPGVVHDELELVYKDISAGVTTNDALERFAQRAPSDSVKTFAKSVQSAIKSNAPLAEILNSRAKASREEFFAYVNQKVAQLESKIWMILSPTMLPALMIITVAPSGSQLMSSL